MDKLKLKVINDFHRLMFQLELGLNYKSDNVINEILFIRYHDSFLNKDECLEFFEVY